MALQKDSVPRPSVQVQPYREQKLQPLYIDSQDSRGQSTHSVEANDDLWVIGDSNSHELQRDLE